MMSNRSYARDAGQAMSTLYVLSAVQELLEGGTIHGGKEGAEDTKRKIIALCKKEMQRQLKRYDLAIARIED
jgi:hypothetical protein